MTERITGKTRLTGLLGSPVTHSISPMMHNEAFKELGLDYAYLAFDVGTDKLEAAVEGLKVLNVRGFNVTMPDKNLMCSLCDHLSPAAEIIGAVNTVVNEDGVLTGYTTDGIGYMMSVKDAGYDVIEPGLRSLYRRRWTVWRRSRYSIDGLRFLSVQSRSLVS